MQHAAAEQAVRMEWSTMARPSGSQGDAGHGGHGGHEGHGDGDLEDLGRFGSLILLMMFLKKIIDHLTLRTLMR